MEIFISNTTDGEGGGQFTTFLSKSRNFVHFRCRQKKSLIVLERGGQCTVLIRNFSVAKSLKSTPQRATWQHLFWKDGGYEFYSTT